MIAPNPQNNIKRAKQQRRQASRQAAQHRRRAAQQAQITLNAILWQIITEHAEPTEDEVETTPVLTVPLSEIKNVPANFGLTIKANPEEDTLSVFAGLVKPKSNIILPDRSILNG